MERYPVTRFLQKNPTKLMTVQGIAFYECPDEGDLAPLLTIINGHVVITNLVETDQYEAELFLEDYSPSSVFNENKGWIEEAHFVDGKCVSWTWSLSKPGEFSRAEIEMITDALDVLKYNYYLG